MRFSDKPINSFGVPFKMDENPQNKWRNRAGRSIGPMSYWSPDVMALRMRRVLHNARGGGAPAASCGPERDPDMFSKLLIAWILMSLCVVIHAAGLTAAFRWMQARAGGLGGSFWSATWMLVRTAGWTLLMHLLQIAVWAFFYAWQNGMPGLQAALYFSAVTYTTTGYGDLVLTEEWRLVGAIEALTGILMCGLSTGFFFAVFSRIFKLNGKTEPTG